MANRVPLALSLFCLIGCTHMRETKQPFQIFHLESPTSVGESPQNQKNPYGWIFRLNV
jgi:hypothetical protein